MEGTRDNQNKQIETQGEGNTLSSLSIFGRNEHFAYVFKKTERLATAVYMITNFIKDNEPLKWKIRENVIELLSLNSAWNTVALSERRDLIKKYQMLSLEIVSLSGIAHHSGLISEMNFHILSREFNNLISVMDKGENKSANEETVVVNDNFFDVSKPASQAPVRGSVSIYESASETRSGKFTAQDFNKGQVANLAADIPRIDTSVVKDRKETSAKVADSKDGRQATIIKLLSKKSGLNVNDFADSIKGVSAKTIQRELLSMVASGVLKKEGERRWSTYSLK